MIAPMPRKIPSMALQRALLALVFLASSLAPSSLAAQASEPGEPAVVAADEEARVVFQRDREAYARGEYEPALAAFRQAYELSGRAELQFNIGQAADRLRHDREARDAFEAYLAALPDASNRVEVEARLRVLREEIARDDALRAQAASGATTPHETSVVEEWWFWTIVGVAVVGAGVGIGFAVGSRDELAAPTPGDVGPGGVVIALEGL
jgi:tetratricopeptide (TPR) repeat protein